MSMKIVTRLLGGSETEQGSEALYCPFEDEETERKQIVDVGTEPDEWEQNGRVAVYHCPVCDRHHRFLWGTPTPLYLGDKVTDSEFGNTRNKSNGVEPEYSE